MPIPTYEELLRPLLALASERDITRSAATPIMADQFELTQAEREERIPSGSSTYIRNRVGWAMSHLTKAALIEKVAPKTYRVTERGRGFLREHPTDFRQRDLLSVPGYREAWNPARQDDGDLEIPEASHSEATPFETLDNSIRTINADLKDRLLRAMLEQTPEFFERLVLDVLTHMGYGGARADAAEHLGRSGDEGIDGRINQDSLGLDQIVVQAKRYAPNRPIDRQTIQAFYGSMAGQGVTKGIFITTSSFKRKRTRVRPAWRAGQSGAHRW